MTPLILIIRLSAFADQFLVLALGFIILLAAVSLFIILTHLADKSDKEMYETMDEFGNYYTLQRFW